MPDLGETSINSRLGKSLRVQVFHNLHLALPLPPASDPPILHQPAPRHEEQGMGTGDLEDKEGDAGTEGLRTINNWRQT